MSASRNNYSKAPNSQPFYVVLHAIGVVFSQYTSIKIEMKECRDDRRHNLESNPTFCIVFPFLPLNKGPIKTRA